MFAVPVSDRRGEDDEHAGPKQVHDHHEPSPVEAVREHAGVETEEQPRQPLEQPGEGHQQRVMGL